MNDLQKEYFKLFFMDRINEYRKIDDYKNWNVGTARNKFQSINDFYLSELKIDNNKFIEIQKYFSDYKVKYDKYYNEKRKNLFIDPDKCIDWFRAQNSKCGYCEISQDDLHKIVRKRNGNFTLNGKTKRSKGTLEIERKDSSLDYSYSNCILSCPLCNNAKSNLIDELSWREYFVKSVKEYYKSLLEN